MISCLCCTDSSWRLWARGLYREVDSDVAFAISPEEIVDLQPWGPCCCYDGSAEACGACGDTGDVGDSQHDSQHVCTAHSTVVAHVGVVWEGLLRETIERHIQQYAAHAVRDLERGTFEVADTALNQDTILKAVCEELCVEPSNPIVSSMLKEGGEGMGLLQLARTHADRQAGFKRERDNRDDGRLLDCAGPQPTPFAERSHAEGRAKKMTGEKAADGSKKCTRRQKRSKSSELTPIKQEIHDMVQDQREDGASISKFWQCKSSISMVMTTLGYGMSQLRYLMKFPGKHGITNKRGAAQPANED